MTEQENELREMRLSARTLANGVALHSCWWKDDTVYTRDSAYATVIVARRDVHHGAWILHNGLKYALAECDDAIALDAFLLQVKPL